MVTIEETGPRLRKTCAQAFVLSDLHLGPGSAATLFRDHEALSGLFSWIAEQGQPSEVILAGDTFDFLQTDGYQGFDVEQAPARLKCILSHGPNEQIVAALRSLVHMPEMQLTVLSGNHDPELLLPEVRVVLERELHVEHGFVLYPDDGEPLSPANSLRPPLWGRVIGPAEHPIWVVHGDRWDPHNAIDRGSIKAAAAAGHPVPLPPGSHLVFEVLKNLPPAWSWIHQLKPELPAVMLLLLYLEPGKTASCLRTHFHLSLQMLKGMIKARVANISRLGPEEKTEEPASANLADSLAASLAAECDAQDVDALLAQLTSAVRDGSHRSPADNVLADHKGVARWLLRAWLRVLRRSDRFQETGASDGLSEPVEHALPEGIEALVAGHTHGWRRQPAGSPRYFNSGTWLPVGSIPEGAVQDVIDQLECGDLSTADSPRSLVQVRWDTDLPEISLLHCARNGIPTEVPR